MNKLMLVFMTVVVCSCNYDSGSSVYTKEIGKSISLECLKSNLKGINGLAIQSESEKSIVLVAPGIASTIEFESEGSFVKSYSISTKTEKSSDKIIHKAIETAIDKPCNP